MTSSINELQGGHKLPISGENLSKTQTLMGKQYPIILLLKTVVVEILEMAA